MTDKSLEKMTVAELRETADSLEILYEDKATKAELISGISAIINGADEEPAIEAEVAGHKRKGEDRVTIVIAEDAKDKQPVPVGVNGLTYAIKRGVPVSVPVSVVEVLRNAVRKEWDDKMESSYSVPRYPYSVVAE